jgi:hypothetical protein
VGWVQVAAEVDELRPSPWRFGPVHAESARDEAVSRGWVPVGNVRVDGGGSVSERPTHPRPSKSLLKPGATRVRQNAGGAKVGVEFAIFHEEARSSEGHGVAVLVIGEPVVSNLKRRLRFALALREALLRNLGDRLQIIGVANGEALALVDEGPLHVHTVARVATIECDRDGVSAPPGLTSIHEVT